MLFWVYAVRVSDDTPYDVDSKWRFFYEKSSFWSNPFDPRFLAIFLRKIAQNRHFCQKWRFCTLLAWGTRAKSQILQKRHCATKLSFLTFLLRKKDTCTARLYFQSAKLSANTRFCTFYGRQKWGFLILAHNVYQNQGVNFCEAKIDLHPNGVPGMNPVWVKNFFAKRAKFYILLCYAE